MTYNLLISWQQLWYIFLPNLKIRPDVIHFFAYGVPPKGINILLIKWLFLLQWLGDFDARIVPSKPTLWFQLSNDAVLLWQHIPDSPCKFWVACNTALYHIFGHLHMIWVFHILEGHPCCACILTFDKDFNPLCCFSVALRYSINCDARVLLLYFSTLVPMVDNLLE